MRPLKFGTSGVRGVVGEALTPELVVNFAAAFGTWCDAAPVVVGRDTRRSSSMLHAALSSGLLSCGCEVIDLGVASTPLIAFAVRELGAGGGVAVTGSHNDARWNALKFIGPDGVLLNAVKSEELLDIYHASAYLLVGWDELQGTASEPQVTERYLDHLLSSLDVAAIRAKGFRVALDFCNGACAEIAQQYLGELGCRLFAINEEPSGEFAHAPAPTARNMRQLATLTRHLEADLGAAINVDGDRIGFVTPEGTPLSEEYSLPLAAIHRLARRPGCVVTNQSSSRMVEAVAAEHGGTVRRTLVGESHVIELGLDEEAVLAGEGSGGVAALPQTTTFDALLTLGLVLESLAVTAEPLSALVARLPSYTMLKGELASPPELVYKTMEGFRLRYAERHPDCSDGVRVEWDDAWLHVRASNTEPLLRVIAEADTPPRAATVYDDALTYARRLAFGHEGV